MNAYRELKDKQQAEVNAFPMFFAFSQQQFDEGMKKLGLEPTDTDKIYKLGNTGGFYRKSDSEALHAMFERHEQEMKDAIAADKTGDGFIFDMFDYELANHEYGYTRDMTDALEALGLTLEDINADQRLVHGLQKAHEAQIEWYNKHN